MFVSVSTSGSATVSQRSNARVTARAKARTRARGRVPIRATVRKCPLNVRNISGHAMFKHRALSDHVAEPAKANTKPEANHVLPCLIRRNNELQVPERAARLAVATEDARSLRFYRSVGIRKGIYTSRRHQSPAKLGYETSSRQRVHTDSLTNGMGTATCSWLSR